MEHSQETKDKFKQLVHELFADVDKAKTDKEKLKAYKKLSSDLLYLSTLDHAPKEFTDRAWYTFIGITMLTVNLEKHMGIRR